MTTGKDRTEYPPLLPAGFHDLQEDDLHDVFVGPFNPPGQRTYLVSRLRLFLRQLRAVALDCEVWLNGSFATRKPEPDDVDIVIIMRAAEVDSLPSDRKALLEAILAQKGDILVRYGVDLYFCEAEDLPLRSYWRGWFGFTRDERPKGIPRIGIS